MPISSQSTHYSHDIPSHICIKFVASAVLNTIKIVIKLAMEKKIELLCHCERRMRHRRFSFFLFCTILTNGTTNPLTVFTRFSPDKTVYLKSFWSQLETVHLQGPCCLRPCSLRPYCNVKIWMKLLFLFVRDASKPINQYIYSVL